MYTEARTNKRDARILARGEKVCVARVHSDSPIQEVMFYLVKELKPYKAGYVYHRFYNGLN